MHLHPLLWLCQRYGVSSYMPGLAPSGTGIWLLAKPGASASAHWHPLALPEKRRATPKPGALAEGRSPGRHWHQALFLKEIFTILSLLNDGLSKIVVPVGATPSVRSTGANYHFLYL
jgi:hypothetical protein